MQDSVQKNARAIWKAMQKQNKIETAMPVLDYKCDEVQAFFVARKLRLVEQKWIRFCYNKDKNTHDERGE